MDLESTWIVQPANATIAPNNNGSSWDVDGSPPDVSVWLNCPTGAVAVSQTPQVESYSPTWTTGGCSMKAKDLISTGFDFQVFDIDTISNDTITSKFGPNKIMESSFVSGGIMLNTATGGLLTLQIALTKQ